MSETMVVSVHGMPPDLAKAMRNKKRLDANLVDIYSEALDQLTTNIKNKEYILQGPVSYKGAKIYPVRIRKESFNRAQDALEKTNTRLSSFLRTAVYRYLEKSP